MFTKSEFQESHCFNSLSYLRLFFHITSGREGNRSADATGGDANKLLATKVPERIIPGNVILDTVLFASGKHLLRCWKKTRAVAFAEILVHRWYKRCITVNHICVYNMCRTSAKKVPYQVWQRNAPSTFGRPQVIPLGMQSPSTPRAPSYSDNMIMLPTWWLMIVSNYSW